MKKPFDYLCPLVLSMPLVGCATPVSSTTESETQQDDTPDPTATEDGTTGDGTSEDDTTESTTTDPTFGFFCVAEGSLVRTPRGERPIEALAVGDPVFAYDLERAAWVSAPIEGIRQSTEVTFGLRVEGKELLVVTPTHPIYSPRLGKYVPARRWETHELSEVLHVAADGRATPAQVSVEAVAGTRRVFDLTVGSAQHNFVADGVLVHNKSEDIHGVSECDPWLQDCPDGEKCVPYASAEDGLDANKCVDIQGDGQAGQACTYGGAADAHDDCGPGSYCWNVQEVDGVMTGTCAPFCAGVPDEAVCEPGSACLIANGGSVTLCVEICDPLLQECGPGLGCVWAQDEFLCAPSQATALGEACDALGDCAPGLACLAAELVPNCADAACCASFCDLAAPSCAQPGTECVPFFDMQMAPPEHEDVGICVLP